MLLRMFYFIFQSQCTKVDRMNDIFELCWISNQTIENKSRKYTHNKTVLYHFISLNAKYSYFAHWKRKTKLFRRKTNFLSKRLLFFFHTSIHFTLIQSSNACPLIPRSISLFPYHGAVESLFSFFWEKKVENAYAKCCHCNKCCHF